MGCETEHGGKRMQRVDWQAGERRKLRDCSVKTEEEGKEQRHTFFPPAPCYILGKDSSSETHWAVSCFSFPGALSSFSCVALAGCRAASREGRLCALDLEVSFLSH